MDSPEYKTLTQCFPNLFTCVKQSPNHVVVQLRPSGILAPNILEFLDNSHNNNDQKAEKIINSVLCQVQINPKIFYTFVLALKASGSWTETVVSELEHTHTSLSAPTNTQTHTPLPVDRSNTLTLENSDSTSQVTPHPEPRSLDQSCETRPTPEAVRFDTAESTLNFDQETIRMQRRFAGLEHKVIASIEESGKTVKDLVTFFQQIQPMKKAVSNSCSIFSHKLLHQIQTVCDDIDAVFEILEGYYSWFNFDLIECIIKEFCDKEIKAKLSNYKRDMGECNKYKLCQFSDRSLNGFGEHRDDMKPCVYMVDEQWEVMRFGELGEIKTIICRILKLRTVVLFLQAVSCNGCIKMTFDIPEHVAGIVFPLSDDQIKALKKRGIHYHDKSLQDSESQQVLYDPETPSPFLQSQDTVAPNMPHLPAQDDVSTSGVKSNSAFDLNEPQPSQSKASTLVSTSSQSQDRSKVHTEQNSTSDLSDESPPVDSLQSGANSSGSTSESNQKSYLQFECGCGKCSVYDYISGKPCPNPIELPFPKLEISECLPDQIEYIEEDLQHRTKLMYREFCSLVSDTFEALSERVEHSKLISHLMMILTPGWELQYALSASKSAESFNNVNLINLPKYLIDKNYCSWFDYDIIEHLRKRYLFPNVADEDEALNTYKEHFKSYAVQRCFIYLHDTGPWPKNQVDVKCKLDTEYGQLSQKLIKHLKYVFAKTIGAPPYHLAFKTAQEGCTELYFGAPLYFSEITKLSKYQISQLRDHGFIEVITCGRNLLQSMTNEGSEPGNVSGVSDDESSIVDVGDLKSNCSLSDSGSISEAAIDIKLTCTENKPEVSYAELMSMTCKKELKLEEEMQLKVSPCSFWKASHGGHPYMALVYNGNVSDDLKAQFSEFANDMLIEKRNVLKARCVHLDKQKDHPILLFKSEQSLKDYCISCEALSEVEQLSMLRDVAVGTLGFLSRMEIKVTIQSIFVRKESDGKIRALFSPLYQYSCFPQNKQPSEPSTGYEWIRDGLLLMHYRDQYNEHSELPEGHILYNIMKYKWFSDDKSLHPKDVTEVAKEIDYILDLENTRLGLIDALSSSDFLEISHLHMLLFGHTGVGKTSLRKHLQNIPFNEQEKSTIIMEQELLCQETMAASTDPSSVVFHKSESVYKSEPDKVFLTLWDTGGQPMFQDLLPCFAKLRSIYGIVFRICDLLENSKAIVRPVCSLECEQESPYTYIEHIYRSLAFLDSFSSGLLHNFSALPTEVKSALFESTELPNFPKLALIGTFKDTVREDELQLVEKYVQLRKCLESSHQYDRALLPVSEKSVVFEIDNTRSGQKYEDPGMIDLRKQIIGCTESAKAKIPSEWISFKVALEHESLIQQPCTGIVTFKKATEIARQNKIDPIPALYYFHELGIFVWYHEKESLREYVIIEPKNLVSILGTILNPEKCVKLPEQWEQLQTKGIISTEVGEQLLDNSSTGLPLRWIFSFFEENHLSIALNEGYFIPSMLQVVPICPNYLHVYDSTNSVCTPLPPNTDTEAAPLFLVSKFKCIPPGLFPRLMTVLAGIQDGDLVWKLSVESKHCKNRVLFLINEQARVECMEFFPCVRILLTSLSEKEISRELCRGILSQLRVQVQRVFLQANEPPVTITFACFCSSSPHFLPSLPSTTEDIVYCHEQPFKLTKAHSKWIREPAPKTDEDAKRLLEEAIKNGSVFLKIISVVFIGSTKKMLLSTIKFGEQEDSNYYMVDDYKVRSLQPDILESYFASNAAFPVSPLRDESQFASSSDEQPAKEVLDSEVRDESQFASSSDEQPAKEVFDSEDDSSQTLDNNSFKATVVSKTPSNESTKQSRPVAEESTSNSSSIKKASETRNSESVKESAEVSVNVDRTAVLSSMLGTSGEQRQLSLIHTIENSEIMVLKLLPLFTQQFSVGVIGTEQIKMLKEIQHVSDKWMVVQTEEDKMTESDIAVMVSPVKDKLLVENTQFNIVFPIHAARKQIVKLTNKAERKVMPYAWYYLCHYIQKRFRETDRKVVSYSEVLFICHHCHIPSDSLENILSHLHKSGLLVFFSKALPSLIFESISMLVSILQSVLSKKALYGSDCIITEASFQEVEDIYIDGIFTYEHAIELFKGLCVMLQIDSHSFSIPYFNQHFLNRKELTQYCKQASNLPVLCIEYSMTKSVFSFLVCFVTSNHNQELWPWKLHTSKTTREPTCLFNNCAQYTLPGYACVITLFNSESFLEVRVDHDFLDDEPPLGPIRRTVIAGLEKAHDSFCSAEKFSYKIGFLCICGSVNKEHIASLSEKKLFCSEKLEATVTPSHLHQIWLKNTISPEEDSITVNSVFKALLPHCQAWFKVGRDLSLDTQTLSQISVNHKSSADIALMMVIKKWFKINPNPNWTTIESLLSSQHLNDINDKELEGSNHGYIVLSNLCAKVIRGLSREPKTLGHALLEKGLLSQEKVEEIVQIPATDTENARKIYNMVLGCVQHFPHRYRDFVTVLKENSLLYGDLLSSMREAYNETETCLTLSDLKVVYQKVFEARAKWQRIGIELNLTSGTLDLIKQKESDPADQLEMVLTEWINKGGATWRELVEALFSVPVGETKLARQLDQSHCSGRFMGVGAVKESPGRGGDVILQLNSDIRTMERKFVNVADDVELNPGPRRAGGIETIPGPTEITVQSLSQELEKLTRPILFGTYLGIPTFRLAIIKANYPDDKEKQKVKVFEYIENNYQAKEFTWEGIAKALEQLSYGDLAKNIRKKFCQLMAKIRAPILRQAPVSGITVTVHSRKSEDLEMPLTMGIAIQSVVIGNNMYVGGGLVTFSMPRNSLNCVVMKLDLEQNTWSKLKMRYSHQNFAMTSLANQLVLVGGCDVVTEEPTNQVVVLESDKWIESPLYPPLNVARSAATAVRLNDTHLFVVGGHGKEQRFSSVEVLEVGKGEWHYADQSLPVPRSSMKSALLGNTLYLMGGTDHDYNNGHCHPTKVVYEVNLADLIDKVISKQPTTTLWKPLQDTPLEHSTPLTFGDFLFAIGGRDNISDLNPSSYIYCYKPDSRVWMKVGELSTARYLSACSVLPSGEVIVVGGEMKGKCIGDVEFLRIN